MAEYGTTHQTQDWTTEVLTSSDMNNYITDPIEGLANPPRDIWTGADQTPAASNTWEVVNVNGDTGGGEMSLSITPDRDGWIWVSVICQCDTTYETEYHIAFDLDGTRFWATRWEGTSQQTIQPTQTATRIFYGLTENQTYTLKLQIRQVGPVMKTMYFKQFAAWAVI